MVRANISSLQYVGQGLRHYAMLATCRNDIAVIHT